MSQQNKTITTGTPIDSIDAFWLEQGRNMLLPRNLDNLANSLITLLGVILGFIQAIYLAIIGFSNIIPKNLTYIQVLFFLSPVIFWLLALYSCMRVSMNPKMSLDLRAPDEIRNAHLSLLRKKQTSILFAFIWLAFGIIISVAVIIFFSKYK